jgi:cardiolipin synthase
MQALFLNTVYPNLGSLEQRPNPLAAALASHANVELHCERSTFDHAKVFVFDRHTVVLGSMGIGDNHRDEWLDVMVECHGPEFIDRLTKRSFGTARFDRDRGLDYLLFCRSHVEGAPCDLLLQRLALIEGARRRIAIEMAYLGDRRFTDALADAVGRGVDVTLLTSKADVIGDLNLATCNELLRRTRPRSNLRIAIHPRVVHSKVMVIDGRLCDIGSANFTPLSHGVYDEVDLFADDSALAGDLEQMIERHCEQAKIAAKRVPFRRIYCYVERAIVGYQARGVR